MIGAHGAECRDAARPPVFGPLQQEFEFADFVTAVQEIGRFIVFDRHFN